MRSVRCDVCGTKALMAASQCPKCSHPFEVRDGFGELLPLAHCASCDSYYPQSLGSCRWCGTKPERAPIGPLVWKGFGILTFASLAIGAWIVKNDSSSPPKPVRTFVADTQPTNQPKAVSFGRKIVVQQDSFRTPDSSSRVALADSTGVVASTAGALDTTQPESTTVVRAEPVSLQSAGSLAQTDSTPSVDNAPPSDPPAPAPVARVVPPPARERATSPVVAPEKSPSRTLAHAPDRTSAARPFAKAPARATAKTPPRVTAAAPKASTTKSSRGWVTSVARNWAVVRSDPSRQSRIIAAIGPNTRVQLGETRGAWRRIKAKGLAGWVEHRTLAVRAVPAKRRLASRN